MIEGKQPEGFSDLPLESYHLRRGLALVLPNDPLEVIEDKFGVQEFRSRGQDVDGNQARVLGSRWHGDEYMDEDQFAVAMTQSGPVIDKLGRLLRDKSLFLIDIELTPGPNFPLEGICIWSEGKLAIRNSFVVTDPNTPDSFGLTIGWWAGLNGKQDYSGLLAPRNAKLLSQLQFFLKSSV